MGPLRSFAVTVKGLTAKNLFNSIFYELVIILEDNLFSVYYKKLKKTTGLAAQLVCCRESTVK